MELFSVEHNYHVVKLQILNTYIYNCLVEATLLWGVGPTVAKVTR